MSERFDDGLGVALEGGDLRESGAARHLGGEIGLRDARQDLDGGAEFADERGEFGVERTLTVDAKTGGGVRCREVRHGTDEQVEALLRFEAARGEDEARVTGGRFCLFRNAHEVGDYSRAIWREGVLPAKIIDHAARGADDDIGGAAEFALAGGGEGGLGGVGAVVAGSEPGPVVAAAGDEAGADALFAEDVGDGDSDLAAVVLIGEDDGGAGVPRGQCTQNPRRDTGLKTGGFFGVVVGDADHAVGELGGHERCGEGVVVGAAIGDEHEAPEERGDAGEPGALAVEQAEVLPTREGRVCALHMDERIGDGRDGGRGGGHDRGNGLAKSDGRAGLGRGTRLWSYRPGIGGCLMKRTDQKTDKEAMDALQLPVGDMTFVVRAAGERTAHAAAALLCAQVRAAGGEPKRQVTVVHECPFVNAVRRTFEIGIESGRPWVIGIDADVLLMSDGVQRLGMLCGQAGERTFTITTLVLCKFFGGFCFRGAHAYPTRLLREALPLIDEVRAGESLRPETAVVQAMMARGYEMLGPPLPVGVHDFKQSYRHIYLKMLLRARREMSDDGGRGFAAYEECVRSRARAGDADCVVASWGLQEGRADAIRAGGSIGSGPAHYDWEGEYPELDGRMLAAGIREKPAWSGREAVRYADQVIAAHDYACDLRTPLWIRDRLGFRDGWERVREGFGCPAVATATAAA